jgi:DNA-binding GntR family transcriptional regulator
MPTPAPRLGVKIERQSTTEQAASALREAILSGLIASGTPLREVSLADELGVSRNTIREAARILGSEGLVRHEMNRGAIVAEITGQDVEEIYAARAVLESAGAEALTAHRDPAVYAALAGFVDQIEAAFGDGDAAAALDGDRLFHATLVAATRNPRLQRFYAQLQQEQRLALSLAERSRQEHGRTTDDHRQLLEALRGTPGQARAELKSHLQAGATELLRLGHGQSRRSGTAEAGPG